jgi:catechol 2,3-dioxygenase-like lactoylglutathione lyase family enzyme
MVNAGHVDDAPDSIQKLIARIRDLVSDPPVDAGSPGYNRYTTQKAHWLGWLGDTPGSGSYERSTPGNRGARYVYNHIVEPGMLLWLIEAAGVEPAVVREAQRVSLRSPKPAGRSKAIRQVVPWPELARALWRDTTAASSSSGSERVNSGQTAASGTNHEGPSRNLASIRPFFIVKDLQTSISFYRERLGFQVDFQGPSDDPYYAGASRDGVGIMLKAILPEVPPTPNHTRHEWARWDAYIYTLDPDALFDEFNQRGVSFVKRLSFIDDGLWGFEVADADGYVLAFFQTRTK